MLRNVQIICLILSIFLCFQICICTLKFKLCKTSREGGTDKYQCLAIIGILHYNQNPLSWREIDDRKTILWVDGIISPLKRQGIFHSTLSAVGLVDKAYQMPCGGRLSVLKEKFDVKSPPSTPSDSYAPLFPNTLYDDEPGQYNMSSGDRVSFYCPPLGTYSAGFGLNEYFYMVGDVSKLYITETLCLSDSDKFHIVSCESPEAVTCERQPVYEYE